MPKMNNNISYYKGWVMLWQFGPPMSALGLQDIIKTVSIICMGPTGLRLRHIGKTDPQCGSPILLSLGPPHLLSLYWLKSRHHAPATDHHRPNILGPKSTTDHILLTLVPQTK